MSGTRQSFRTAEYPLGGAFQTNLYYGLHPAGEPQETPRLTADPLLAAPGGSTPASYQLQAGSPAIGLGTPQAQNGSPDFFGDVLSATAAPSVGFHEGTVFAGPPVLNDGANDFLELARATGNVALDTCHRVLLQRRRLALHQERLLARQHHLAVQGHDRLHRRRLRQADPTAVTFWASPDGRTFTLVATVNTPPLATAGNWSATTFTPRRAAARGHRLPDGDARSAAAVPADLTEGRTR